MLRALLVLGLVLQVQTSWAEKKIYALVPKFMNHPFFEFARLGCKKAEAELKDVECLYIGPSEPDEQAQVQILQDLITRGVAGIAIAPANSPAVGRFLRSGAARGIPVITWDNDLLDSDKSLRRTYIGTRNYDMGVALARELLLLRPQGGTYALQSGEAAALNLNERIKGVRDTLKDSAWKEAPGTPLYNNGDSTLSIQQLNDLLLRLPEINAVVPVGGWPQVVHQAYRQFTDKYSARIKGKELIIVSGDTLPVQMELLKEGRSHAQVGQRPFEMGYRAVMTMKELNEGKSVPADIFTGLDVCNSENVESCVAK